MRDACTESLHQSSGNSVNRNNIKTVGKHGEVVNKPLYKCISEELMHVAARYGGNPLTKVHEIRGISFDWP